MLLLKLTLCVLTAMVHLTSSQQQQQPNGVLRLPVAPNNVASTGQAAQILGALSQLTTSVSQLQTSVSALRQHVSQLQALNARLQVDVADIRNRMAGRPRGKLRTADS